MTKLTRRELLSGAAAIGVVSAAVGGSENVPECVFPETPQPECHPAPIPTEAQLLEWETQYRARYRALHRARNTALAEHGLDDPDDPGLRVDLAAAKVEAELDAAMRLVDDDTEAVALARGNGFEARRAGLPAIANPHWDQEFGFNEYMAWYAGWVQADPSVCETMSRTRGYTPPSDAPRRRPGTTFT